MTRPLRRWHLPVLVLLFIASRAWMAHAGVRFDASPLDYYWQYADPKLLREDLLRTVFYLHSQPPLFNLWLGCVLKLFPLHYAVAFSWTFYGLGLLLTVTMFSLLVLLRVPRWLAFVLTAVFIMSPDLILYERWLFYEYPAMVLMALLAYLFCRFVVKGELWCAGGAAAVAATLSLTIASFHPLWVALVVAAMCLLWRCEWRRVLLWCAIPLVVVAGAGVKQRVVFGHWGMATWHAAGALSLATAMRVSIGWREEMHKQGKITEWSLTTPYSDSATTYDGIAEVPQWGVPVLDEFTKSTGSVNRHHAIFLAMSDDLARDGWWLLWHHPEIVEPIWPRFKIWLFKPSEDCWGVPHFDCLTSYTRWYERIVFGSGGGFLALWLVLPLAWTSLVAIQGLRGLADRTMAAACGFLAVNVLGLNLPMILLSGYEQHRYRFRTAALSFVLVALLLVQVGRAVGRMWRAYDPKLTEEREHGSAERLSDVVPVALLDSTPPEASGALGCDGVAVRATEEGGN